MLLPFVLPTVGQEEDARLDLSHGKGMTFARFVFMGLAATAALAGRGATFLVDARAKAGGDGSAAKPWRTVAEAVAGVRAARAAGAVQAGEGVAVEFLPGDYPVDGGVRLAAGDSGTADAPVVWRTRGAGRARLTGGARVPARSFRPVRDPAVLSRLPAAARGKAYVADVSAVVPEKVPAMADVFGGTPSAPLLFTGGRHGTLARWPNAGFTSFTEVVDHGGRPVKGPDGRTAPGGGAFVYGEARAKRWKVAEGVWLNGYWTHDWDNRSVRVAGYGEENGRADVVRLAADVPYGVMNGTWGRKDRRFYAFNLLDELDAPGEWWLDRARKLLYMIPFDGRPSEADETTLSFMHVPILTVEGAHHLRFERLSFEYGYGNGIVATGSDLVFADCRIANLGGDAVTVRGERNVVRGCEVCNVGRSGITVSGGDRWRLVKSGTRIEGCHVHDWAFYQRTYAPGVGVDGCGVTLRGNRLHDAPHTAVLYGGNEHLFESNEVFRVLLETGDAGAYYTGRDWTTMGNVLRCNYTHDLGAEGGHANTMGFYFDDCDCGDAVYGNVFHNVARGIMVGGGREHPIRGNVFSRCRIGLSIDCRGMTWRQWNSREHGGDSWMLEEKAKQFDYTNGVWAAKYPRLAKIMRDHPREPLYNPVEDNVFVDCRSELLALDGTASQCLERMAPIRNNLVINTVGTNGVRTAKPDGRIAAGFRIVNGTPEQPFDAGFVDPAHGNFALRPDAWLRREMPAFLVPDPNREDFE